MKDFPPVASICYRIHLLVPLEVENSFDTPVSFEKKPLHHFLCAYGDVFARLVLLVHIFLPGSLGTRNPTIESCLQTQVVYPW